MERFCTTARNAITIFILLVLGSFTCSHETDTSFSLSATVCVDTSFVLWTIHEKRWQKMKFFFHLENWFDVNYPSRWPTLEHQHHEETKKIVPARAHLDDTFVYIFTFHFAFSSFCIMWTTYDERHEGGGCWAIMRTTQQHRAEDVEQINKFYCFRELSLVDFSSLFVSRSRHISISFSWVLYVPCSPHKSFYGIENFHICSHAVLCSCTDEICVSTYTQAFAQLREKFMIF